MAHTHSEQPGSPPQTSHLFEVIYLLFLFWPEMEKERSTLQAEEIDFHAIEECLGVDFRFSYKTLGSLIKNGLVTDAEMSIVKVNDGTTPEKIATARINKEGGFSQAEGKVFLAAMKKFPPQVIGEAGNMIYTLTADSKAVARFIDQQVGLWRDNLLTTNNGSSLTDSAQQVADIVGSVHYALGKYSKDSLNLPDGEDKHSEKLMGLLWMHRVGWIRIDAFLWSGLGRLEALVHKMEGWMEKKVTARQGYCPPVRIGVGDEFFIRFAPDPSPDKAAWRKIIAAYMGRQVPGVRNEPIPHFPPPPGTKWGDVTITFTSPHDVEVRVKNKSLGIFSYAALGLQDSRSKQPTKQWALLRQFAFFKGEATVSQLATPQRERNNFSKQKEILSRKLRLAFGIDADPFLDFRKERIHRSRFVLLPEDLDPAIPAPERAVDILEGMDEQFG